MSLQAQTKDFAAKADLIGGRFPGLAVEGSEQGLLVLRCDRTQLLDVMKYLRDDPALVFGQLSDLTAVDEPGENRIVVLYRLVKPVPVYDTMVVKVAVPRDSASCPSVIGLWANADWYEREVFDMFGVTFTGREELRRILTWKGFEGHPLRKDFRMPEPGEGVRASE